MSNLRVPVLFVVTSYGDSRTKNTQVQEAKDIICSQYNECLTVIPISDTGISVHRSSFVTLVLHPPGF